MTLPVNCWPTPSQYLLLQAGLFDSPRARVAFNEHCNMTHLQKLDHVSSTLLPLVFHNLQPADSEDLHTCKSVYRHTWSYNQLQFFKLAPVLQAFKTASIEACLLKGAAMILHYYQDAGLRVMGDVDILVPRTQAKKAVQVLTDLGWTSETKLDIDLLLTQTHALLFTHPEGYSLDLHWIILGNSALDRTLLKYQHRYISSSLPQNKMTVLILRPEDQLLHTLIHGLKYSAQSLIRWIPDTSMILKKTPDFDWEYFLIQTKTLRLDYVIKTALCSLHDHGFVEIPLKILNILHGYKPKAHELKYFELITQKPTGFSFTLQMFWHCHIRNSSSQSALILFFTLPAFLKEFWQLKHWHQVPLHLFRRIFFHLRKNFLSRNSL